MPPLEREAHRLRSLIDDADAIIVGIGSGMSSAAGFNHYNRAGMARAGMGDWQQAFGFKSLFDGFYHLYPSLEQQWAYYARYIERFIAVPPRMASLTFRLGCRRKLALSTRAATAAARPRSSTSPRLSAGFPSPISRSSTAAASSKTRQG